MYFIKIKHPKWLYKGEHRYASYFVGPNRFGAKRFAKKFTSLAECLEVLHCEDMGNWIYRMFYGELPTIEEE